MKAALGGRVLARSDGVAARSGCRCVRVADVRPDPLGKAPRPASGLARPAA